MRQPTNPRSKKCTVDGCERLAEPEKSFCYGHRKQRIRQLAELRQRDSEGVDPGEVEPSFRPLRPYAEHPREGLARAALAYADASTELDHARSKRRLLKMAIRYVAALR